jgi:hypothetical protein
MTKRLFYSGLLLLFLIPAFALNPAYSQSTTTAPQFSLGPTTPYSAAAQSSNDVFRFRRGERYNLQNSSIPQLGESSEPILLDLPESHSEREPLPIQKSDAVVVATVQNGQSFLSNDKRNIYSEYRATVEDVVKTPSTPYLRTGDGIDVEREGGVVQLPSGKTLVRGKIADSKPAVGGRYLFFLKYNPDTEDYHIQTAYQLHGGKAYRLDDNTYSENDSDKTQHALRIEAANADEFLVQVRARAKKGGSQ